MDPGIISGGFTKFEFMCIGTPFGLISLSPHQEVLAKRLPSRGYDIFLGKVEYVLARSDRFHKMVMDLVAGGAAAKRNVCAFSEIGGWAGRHPNIKYNSGFDELRERIWREYLLQVV